MHEEAALHKFIVEDPMDDTSRLAYADWLEEHGNEIRGQFIRFQIEASQRGYNQESARAAADDLLKANRYEWERSLRNHGASDIEWERGFPYHVRFSQSRHILADISRSRYKVNPDAETVFDIAPITSLDLTGANFDYEGMRALATSPKLRQITHLNLTHAYRDPEVLQALGLSAILRHVISLDLRDNPIGTVGAQVIMQSMQFFCADMLIATDDSDGTLAELRQRFSNRLRGGNENQAGRF